MAFRFILAVFLAYFLKKEDKQALLSLLLEILGNNNSREVDGKEVDGEETNSKVVYSKDIGNGKAGSEKVRGFLADFTLSIF